MHVPKKLRDIINKEMNDILKSFEGYNSRMVLFIKVKIKTDRYLVIVRNQCRSKVTLRYHIKHKYWNFYPVSTGHTILVVNKKKTGLHSTLSEYVIIPYKTGDN
jgi:hypothetical protein